ncbi:MAG: hypothetical protein ACKO2V_26750, partial [Snowella sp.]
MPYAGLAIYFLLTVWTVAAIILGLKVLIGITLFQAFVVCGLGFVVLLILQRTLGYPFISAIHWLSGKLLGIELTIDKKRLQQILETASPQPEISFPGEDNQQEETKTDHAGIWQRYLAEMSLFIAPISDKLLKISNPQQQAEIRKFKRIFKYLGIGLLSLVVITLISPARGEFLAWHLALDDATRLMVDLIGFSLMLLFLGLFLEALTSPIEALGWWAGWYSPRLVYAQES